MSGRVALALPVNLGVLQPLCGWGGAKRTPQRAGGSLRSSSATPSVRHADKAGGARRGLTLVEIILVLSLLVIIGAVTVPLLEGSLRASRLSHSGDLLRRLVARSAGRDPIGRNLRISFRASRQPISDCVVGQSFRPGRDACRGDRRLGGGRKRRLGPFFEEQLAGGRHVRCPPGLGDTTGRGGSRRPMPRGLRRSCSTRTAPLPTPSCC